MRQVFRPGVLQDWSAPAARLQSYEGPGKPSRLTRGAWVADLAALKKAIFLCWGCQRKWDPKPHHYHKHRVCPGFPEARSDCDGCGTRNALCAYYRHDDMRV